MSKKNIAAIEVKNISKSFRIPLDGNSGIKQKILNIFKHKKGYRDFTPLDNVTFQINKGEFFGIVGRNGSGKSTLLKTIAGIYVPDKGHVKVNGLLVPFIELGVGFNPELSGRENVYLNAALLGFSRKETYAMYEEIVDFAELHDFMEEQLKNYSSGMQVRLAFSIAIQAKGDILLLDEVLAVGDSAFQQKCMNYFALLKKEKRTVVLVTHSMAAVERFCDRALLLNEGKIVATGLSNEIANQYSQLFIERSNSNEESAHENHSRQVQYSVQVEQGEKTVRTVAALKDFRLKINIKPEMTILDANVGINIRDDRKNVVFSTDTKLHIGDTKLNKGENSEFTINIENKYTTGRYSIDLNIVNEASVGGGLLVRKPEVATFEIMGIASHEHSLFHPDIKVFRSK